MYPFEIFFQVSISYNVPFWIFSVPHPTYILPQLLVYPPPVAGFQGAECISSAPVGLKVQQGSSCSPVRSCLCICNCCALWCPNCKAITPTSQVQFDVFWLHHVQNGNLSAPSRYPPTGLLVSKVAAYTSSMPIAVVPQVQQCPSCTSVSYRLCICNCWAIWCPNCKAFTPTSLVATFFQLHHVPTAKPLALPEVSPNWINWVAGLQGTACTSSVLKCSCSAPVQFLEGNKYLCVCNYWPVWCLNCKAFTPTFQLH